MNLQHLKKIASSISILSVLKVLLLSFGTYTIYYTLNIITINNLGFIERIFSLILSFFIKLMPFLIPLLNMVKEYLIIPSIQFLGFPILIYIIICLITPSLLWRKFLSLVAICMLLLFLHSFIFTGYSLPDVSTINLINFGNYLKDILLNTKNIFAYIAGIYLFILWIFPSFTWAFFSGTLLFLAGLAETIIPTQAIPYVGGLIELFTLSTFFAYLFLFLHSLAGLVKIFAKSSFINQARELIASFVLKIFTIK